jgi:hypothetical protein
MKKTLIILSTFVLILACKKETTTTFRSDAPNCVVNIAKSFSPNDATIKKMTDGKAFYWQVQTEGSPQIADDEFLYIFNDNCDTLCRVCFCPKRGDCSVDLTKLTEVK